MRVLRESGELRGRAGPAGHGQGVGDPDGLIAQAALTWIGTPFHHQARGPKGPGGGTDCIGLLVGVAQELGLVANDGRAYSREPHPEQLLERMASSCDRLSGEEPLQLRKDTGAEQFVSLGRIALFFFTYQAKPQHAGIITKDGFVHTYAGALDREVKEHNWTASWKSRLHSVWAYRWLSP